MHNKLIAVLIGLTLLFGGGTAGAASETSPKETGKATTTPVSTNIGFIKNPPKELKERFPMCDAFLKVDWIDKEKKVGYSNYEAIIKGKKKKLWTLLYVGDVGAQHDWDVYQYKQQGRLKEIFEMIKYGTDEGNMLVWIPTYKGKSVAIHYISFERGRDSLADFRLNVCVPYPDEQKVWIVEGRSVKHTYSEAQRAELLERISQSSGRSLNKNNFESLWVLDVNFDGQEDFVLDRLLVATWSNKMYVTNDEYNSVKQEFQVMFPPNGRSCRMDARGSLTLTTDGKHYYINKCNITELTSKPGEE